MNKNLMDHMEVRRYLPHRYPFLLVDIVQTCTAYESIVALKNVTQNEPFFLGHFPNMPVMPGVLIVEAMAQAAGVLTYYSYSRYPTDADMFYFAGIDKTRFKRKVSPGDQLILKVKVARHRETLWKFEGEAFVGDELACSSEFMTIKG